jgi:hypothetical protein
VAADSPEPTTIEWKGIFAGSWQGKYQLSTPTPDAHSFLEVDFHQSYSV